MAENVNQGEQSEITAEFLQFVALQEDSKIKLSDAYSVPSHASLLAVSNKYGFVVYGTHHGFGFIYTNELVKAFKNVSKRQTITLSNKKAFNISIGLVQFVRLSADDLTLVFGLDNGRVLLYDVTEIVKADDGASIQPYKEHLFGDTRFIRDIRPNPETFGSIIMVLLSDGTVNSMNLDGYVTDMKQTNVSAISWSPRGKQLACGLTDGDIVFITPEGVNKGRLLKYPGLDHAKVHNLFWFENSIYSIIYSSKDGEVTVAVVVQESKPKRNLYYKFSDPTMPFGNPREIHYYMDGIKHWDSKADRILIFANVCSPDVGVIGASTEGSWSNWSLGETYRAAFPLSKSGDDTWPVGLSLDFTSQEVIPAKNEYEADTPAVPMMLMLNNEGELMAYHVINTAAVKNQDACEGMSKAESIPDKRPALSGSKEANAQSKQAAWVPPGVSDPAASMATSKSPPTALSPKPATPILQVPGKVEATSEAVILQNKLVSETFQSPDFSFNIEPSTTKVINPPASSGPQPVFKFSVPTAANSTTSASELKKIAPSAFSLPKPATVSPFNVTPSTIGTAAPSFKFGVVATNGAGTAPLLTTTLQTHAATSAAPAFAGFKIPNATPSTGQNISGNPTGISSLKSPVQFPAASQTQVRVESGRTKEMAKPVVPLPSRPIEATLPPAMIASVAPKAAASKPIQPVQPLNSLEIIQNKFDDLQRVIDAEIDRLKQRYQRLSQTIHEANSPTVAGQIGIGNLSKVLANTGNLRNELARLQAEDANSERERENLRARLLAVEAKRDESQRRLDAIKNPALMKTLSVRKLGPEMEELRVQLGAKRQDLEQGIRDMSLFLEVQSKRNDRKKQKMESRLRSPDFDTICRTIEYITHSAITVAEKLDFLLQRLKTFTLEWKLHNKTPPDTGKEPRKSNSFGLDDSESEFELDEEEVNGREESEDTDDDEYVIVTKPKLAAEGLTTSDMANAKRFRELLRESFETSPRKLVTRKVTKEAPLEIPVALREKSEARAAIFNKALASNLEPPPVELTAEDKESLESPLAPVPGETSATKLPLNRPVMPFSFQHSAKTEATKLQFPSPNRSKPISSEESMNSSQPRDNGVKSVPSFTFPSFATNAAPIAPPVFSAFHISPPQKPTNLLGNIEPSPPKPRDIKLAALKFGVKPESDDYYDNEENEEGSDEGNIDDIEEEAEVREDSEEAEDDEVNVEEVGESDLQDWGAIDDADASEADDTVVVIHPKESADADSIFNAPKPGFNSARSVASSRDSTATHQNSAFATKSSPAEPNISSAFSRSSGSPLLKGASFSPSGGFATPVKADESSSNEKMSSAAFEMKPGTTASSIEFSFVKSLPLKDKKNDDAKPGSESPRTSEQSFSTSANTTAQNFVPGPGLDHENAIDSKGSHDGQMQDDGSIGIVFKNTSFFGSSTGNSDSSTGNKPSVFWSASTNPAPANLFGSGTTSLFGSVAAAAPISSGFSAFGSSIASTSSFDGFGGLNATARSPASPTAGSDTFGKPVQGFASVAMTNNASAFGQSSNMPFDAQARSNAFGSASSISSSFGKPSFGGGTFGSPSPLGGGGLGGFGSIAPSSNRLPFVANAAGATFGSTGFGSVAPTTSFGSISSGFGQAATTSSAGATSTTSGTGFGAFGGAPSAFGAIGSQQQPSAFGTSKFGTNKPNQSSAFTQYR